MWLLILTGLLATSLGKESVEKKTENVDDVVLLEIDVKEPSKRSPVAASAVYGAPSSQFIIRHGDDAQELSPEYLALVEQYTNTQPQQQYASGREGPPPRRPAIPAYARQQQQLQQAYQNQRVPAVAPARPRLTYHPQAEAQADAQAEYQAQLDAQNRAEAQRLRASGTTATEYQLPASYADPKLGTFEQELLQLVSANQAQEFKLFQEQPRRQQKQQAYPQYAQHQVVAYPEYEKPTVEPPQEIPEQQQQYHVETTAPKYPQHVPVAYQPIAENYQSPQQPKRPYRPAYVDPAPQQPHGQTEAQNIAQAQANAQAQALAFQKITQASHLKHQEAALEQIRIVNERHRQQSALEQINQGQVSEAGKEHIVEQLRPKDPEEVYRARAKAQAAAQAAEARRAQEAAEYKAHADAILALQKQQQAHLKAQEDAHTYALNFEKNQAKAQAHAQAIANSQALALWKAHQAARGKAQKEAQSAARAQSDARSRDPDHTPVIQYLLPQNVPLPHPKEYIYTEEFKNYQASIGSNYVQRSTPKPEAEAETVNQPRVAHKHKINPANSQSIYLSQSGHLKKAPVKALSVDDIIDNQARQIYRIPAGKTHTLTQADLNTLVQAGYTVTPVPEIPRTDISTGYYVKKQNVPSARPDYAAYDDNSARVRPRLSRKQRPILRQENEGEGSDRVTYLVPLEPTYGNKTPAQKRLVAEE